MASHTTMPNATTAPSVSSAAANRGNGFMARRSVAMISARRNRAVLVIEFRIDCTAAMANLLSLPKAHAASQ